MTLARRVALSFLLVLALFALNLVVYFWASGQKSDNLAHLRSASERRLVLRAIQHELRERSRESTILSETILDADQVTALRTRLEALQRRPRELAVGNDVNAPEERELAIALARFARAAISVYDAAAGGKRAAAVKARQDADRTAAIALAIVDRLGHEEEGRAAVATERFLNVTTLTHQVSIVTFALSLVFTIVVGTTMAWYIRRGMSRLVQGTRRIAHGDLEHRIETSGSDELDTLAQAFNDMTAQLARAMADLSEARAAAERASKAKGTFLANMSHEFRTPLTSILCYCDVMLQEATLTGQKQIADDVAEMRQAADHLVALVSQVVDLAKIESGRLTLTLEDVNLRVLVDRVQRTMLPVAGRNGNTLVLQADGDIGRMVVDALKLKQILLNLLGNACKFTRNGTVTLRVSRGTREARPIVSFTVTDTGIGIQPEQAARLFQEFEQGDPSIERGYGGSGLGLAISKGLCTVLSGEIGVTSEPGVGTSFTVVLPADLSLAESADASAA